MRSHAWCCARPIFSPSVPQTWTSPWSQAFASPCHCVGFSWCVFPFHLFSHFIFILASTTFCCLQMPSSFSLHFTSIGPSTLCALSPWSTSYATDWWWRKNPVAFLHTFLEGVILCSFSALLTSLDLFLLFGLSRVCPCCWDMLKQYVGSAWGTDLKSQYRLNNSSCCKSHIRSSRGHPCEP